MMHALGFGHEQNRWDRDDYVVVHEDRIDPNMINNFKKVRRVCNQLEYYNIIIVIG